jgi:hypothetical protein
MPTTCSTSDSSGRRVARTWRPCAGGAPALPPRAPASSDTDVRALHLPSPPSCSLSLATPWLSPSPLQSPHRVRHGCRHGSSTATAVPPLQTTATTATYTTVSASSSPFARRTLAEPQTTGAPPPQARPQTGRLRRGRAAADRLTPLLSHPWVRNGTVVLVPPSAAVVGDPLAGAEKTGRLPYLVSEEEERKRRCTFSLRMTGGPGWVTGPT